MATAAPGAARTLATRDPLALYELAREVEIITLETLVTELRRRSRSPMTSRGGSGICASALSCCSWCPACRRRCSRTKSRWVGWA